MPSDLAYWLISAPTGHAGEQELFDGVKTTIGEGVGVGGVGMPELKAGTLSSLLSLSDSLPKTDAYFTSVVVKLLDTIRNLVGDDKAKLEQHARVNDMPVDEYIMPTPGSLRTPWQWDKGRWGTDGKVGDVIEALNKEMSSIDSVQKQRLSSYNLSKGSLTQMQRRKVGNLSTRSLVDVVREEHVVKDSEYLETLCVAVPKNLEKDWNEKYERLTSMVVPRSTQKVASDSEYSLYTVTVFKRVKDEYTHKCRENKFIVRDFKYDADALEKQQKEMDEAAQEEKELWSELLRLSRTNFSEAYQILTHLKVVRVFVESVLRYGLPAEYSAIVIKPNPKTALKTLKTLSTNKLLVSPDKTQKTIGSGKKGNSSQNDEIAGEWGAVMEQEYYTFVLFELPMVVT